MRPAVVLVVEVGCDPLQHPGKRKLVGKIGRWTLEGVEDKDWLGLVRSTEV